MDGWLSVWLLEVDGEDQLHIVPENDLVGHEYSGDCACGPQVEHLGGIDWLYVHHALDGRE